MVKKRIRVVIADDHAVLCAGLRMLLSAQPDMEVVDEASSGPEAVAAAVRLKPDVVLMDLSMPGGGGMTAIGEVRRGTPETRVLVLSMHESEGLLRRALEAGAGGYVVKRAADTELVAAIRAVAGGRQYIDPVMAGEVMSRARRCGEPGGGATMSQPQGLSHREDQVLRLVALGLTSREVGNRLGISARTVETHKARGCAKLGLRSRAALVRHAHERGWLDDPPPATLRPGGDSPDGGC